MRLRASILLLGFLSTYRGESDLTARALVTKAINVHFPQFYSPNFITIIEFRNNKNRNLRKLSMAFDTPYATHVPG